MDAIIYDENQNEIARISNPNVSEGRIIEGYCIDKNPFKILINHGEHYSVKIGEQEFIKCFIAEETNDYIRIECIGTK